LVLRDTQVTTNAISRLNGWESLKVLDLHNLPVDASVSRFLSDVPSLERLDLSGTKMTGLALRHLKPDSLQGLNMNDCNDIGDGVDSIIAFRELVSLSVAGTDICATALHVDPLNAVA
jgi:hypothetical protein